VVDFDCCHTAFWSILFSHSSDFDMCAGLNDGSLEHLNLLTDATLLV
jgi:hypothetical protein